jgi:AraC family transcriptional regulator, alkane utilization regulator
MDALSEVIKSIHLESTTCCRIELSIPWGLQMSAFRGATFLAVNSGNCWLEVTGVKTPIPLMSGDLVFLSQGQSHTVRDVPSERMDAERTQSTIAFDRLLQNQVEEDTSVFHWGGDGLSTTILYGQFKFMTVQENSLLSALPPMLIFKKDTGQSVEWMDTALTFMAAELAKAHPGGQTLIHHLASILLIQIVRAYIFSTECGERCWLTALSDPAIGAALNLIHRHPDRSWTAEEIAEKVGISRTTFFTKFRELVGEPPSQYLTRWRMQRASQILQLGHMTLYEVASLVGYESEASFSKAFKQWMGQSPGAYRQANAAMTRSK